MLRSALVAVVLVVAASAGAASLGAGDACAAVEPRVACDGAAAGGGGSGAPACVAASGLRSVSARPRGGRLRLGFARRRARPVTISVFQHSRGRVVLGERRVARFAARRRAVTWNGRSARGVRDGIFSARFVMRLAGGGSDVRRVALARRGGRFVRRPAFYRRESCGALTSFKLERPAFGGRRNRSLGIAFRLGQSARVTVVVRRRGRVVERLGGAQRSAGVTHRLRLGSERLRRGDHVVGLTARLASGRTVTARLTSRRL